MTYNEPFDKDFDSLLKNTLSRWHIPGISIAIVDKKTSHSKSYGLANIDDQIPADENTLYYAASTTKAQLCAAWGIYIGSSANQFKPLAAQITWRTTLGSIIGPDFQLYDPHRTQAITLEDALSHRTGMPRHDLTRGYAPNFTCEATTKNVAFLPFHNELRTDFEYCNLMFTIASFALEKMTGKSLAEVLREWIWRPLGMEDTLAGLPEVVEGNGRTLATCYTWSPSSEGNSTEERKLTEQPHADLTPAAGAGYIISTATDYAKWMQALLGTSASPVLSRDLTNELWTPRTLVLEPSRKAPITTGIVAYTLGWFAGSYRGHMAYWHSGGVTGAGSFILLVPDLQWGVTFFANGHDVSASIKGLVFDLLDARLGVPAKERTAFEMCEKIYEDGLRDARKAYDTALMRIFPSGSTIDASPSAAERVEQYAGTYRHPNYGQITLRAHKDKSDQSYLLCKMDDRTWHVTFEFHPVKTTASGEWFFVTLYDPSDLARKAMLAKGRRDGRGEVQGLDVAIESAMPTTLLPFERVEGHRVNGTT